MNTSVQNPTTNQALPYEQGNDVESAIKAWLSNYVADLFGLSPNEISGSTTFEQLGIDSAAAVGLSGDLGSWLGVDVDPAIAYEHPSINQLARALAGRPGIKVPPNARKEDEVLGDA